VQTAAVPLNPLPFAAISDEPYSTYLLSLANTKQQAAITVAQQSARDFLTLSKGRPRVKVTTAPIQAEHHG
jgi:hypothetical protein